MQPSSQAEAILARLVAAQDEAKALLRDAEERAAELRRTAEAKARERRAAILADAEAEAARRLEAARAEAEGEAALRLEEADRRVLEMRARARQQAAIDWVVAWVTAADGEEG